MRLLTLLLTTETDMPPVAQQLELEVLARATGEWPGIDPDARARASRRGVFSR